MSAPAAVETFHYVWPVGYNNIHQVKYCQGGCKPQSITPKLPAQSKLFHTVNIFGLNKYFLSQQAVGILFRAGNDTFFCPEPPRSTFRAGLGAFSCPGGGRYPIPRRKRYLFLPRAASEPLSRRIWGIFLPGRRLVSLSALEKIPFSAWIRFGVPSAPDLRHFPARQAGGIPLRAKKYHFSRRTPSRKNATCGTNIWWRAWKRLPKKEICAKVFLFLESAIFEKRNGGKFTLLRGGQQNSRGGATLYGRGLWGTTLSLRGRVVQRFPGYSRRRRMP